MLEVRRYQDIVNDEGPRCAEVSCMTLLDPRGLCPKGHSQKRAAYLQEDLNHCRTCGSAFHGIKCGACGDDQRHVDPERFD